MLFFFALLGAVAVWLLMTDTPRPRGVRWTLALLALAGMVWSGCLTQRTLRLGRRAIQENRRRSRAFRDQRNAEIERIRRESETFDVQLHGAPDYR